MKRDDRQKAIMDLLIAEGEVDLDALCDRYSVSRMTAHRDLDDLEAAGFLRKIRGGATIRSGLQFESDFRFRERQDSAAKTAMAQAALELIEPGMSVMINDGSMAATLGQMLAGKRPLTVITNNAAVIEALRTEAGITLIALGGIYSAKFNAYLGKVTEDALTRLRADIAFISSPAVSGLEVFHMDDSVVRTKRAMIDQGATRVLLVNHARFGRAALHHLAELREFDHIITDSQPAGEHLAAMQEAGVRLTLADAQEAEG
ncbi:MAG: DeoR/GlpR family DNA-binding transcription regulator [Marinovum algicola]|jgi:DeoR/GlpR family transcriptional regulator of sugar metabolism|uniref:Transcriptional regulator, DeoR family n=2 Tax=Marinovum algicola TaxID=42444 RepID=A0A975WCP5_9RHOB|nr:DeoR/GlpR family DNA-binding transcription regulator [Marinovum algicola]AKO99630.1 Transcriptional regulator of sugar metabolism [Marinovum algicola DG 898]SEJ93100.1 transcriptional regulator, DeoR family [Marinovum algicola]SLN66314.1 Glycerol-3-phosphate regulon repressor [Marinovum algicola]